MKTYQFSGTSDRSDFRFDLTVCEEATAEEIEDEISEVLELEGIEPQGGVTVHRVVGSSWGEFEE